MEKSGKDNKNILNINNLHDYYLGSCGYCKEDSKKKSTSCKLGFTCDAILPEDYEKMMFNGWRKCGNYYYLPDLKKSCCQLHTIRLDASEFKLSNKQSKIKRRLHHFLKTGEVHLEENNQNKSNISNSKSNDQFINYIEDLLMKSKLYDLAFKLTPNILNTGLSINLTYIKNKNMFSTNIFNIMYFKSKQNKDLSLELSKIIGKEEFNLQDFLNHIELSKDVSLMTDVSCIKLENLYLNFYLNSEKLISINKNTSEEQNKELNSHTFRVTIDKPDQTSYYSKDKFAVYKKYQEHIHGDDPKTITYDRFNDSWNNNSFSQVNNNSIKLIDDYRERISEYFDVESFKNLNCYGTYNLIFWLDSKIIAVSVIDILPISISSVYCYYDDSYSKLSLGCVTALKEIDLTNILKQIIIDNKMTYYFMGYYVQSCQKMVYKGDYQPSQLLCPITKLYTYLDQRVKKIISLSKGEKLVEEEPSQGIKNEYINIELQEKEVNVILSLFTLDYKGNSFKLRFFIDNYLTEKYKETIIQTFKSLIKDLGKTLSQRFKYELK